MKPCFSETSVSYMYGSETWAHGYGELSSVNLESSDYQKWRDTALGERLEVINFTDTDLKDQRIR
jgi:hypothetical protein